MKAKVIIQDGITQVILTPTSDFETNIIEKMYNEKSDFTLETEARAEYPPFDYRGKLTDHQIVITITSTATATTT
jgi:hypothetical protein